MCSEVRVLLILQRVLVYDLVFHTHAVAHLPRRIRQPGILHDVLDQLYKIDHPP